MVRATYRVALLALILSLALPASVFGSSREHRDVFRPALSGGGVYASAAASIDRGATSVKAKVMMPTPSGYVVPDPVMWPTSSGVSGSPAAFSLWVFVYFTPEACAGAICAPGDLRNADVIGAGYNAAGHIVGGAQLTLSGSVVANSRAFGPPPTPGCACVYETLGEAVAAGHSLADAQIHLAVAPHGVLDPSLMPAQIATPAGGPPHWWMAFFLD